MTVKCKMINIEAFVKTKKGAICFSHILIPQSLLEVMQWIGRRKEAQHGNNINVVIIRLDIVWDFDYRNIVK